MAVKNSKATNPPTGHCCLLKGCNSQLYECFYCHMMAMDRGGVLFIEYSIHTQDGAVTTATGGWLCDGTSSTD